MFLRLRQHNPGAGSASTPNLSSLPHIARGTGLLGQTHVPAEDATALREVTAGRGGPGLKPGSVSPVSPALPHPVSTPGTPWDPAYEDCGGQRAICVSHNAWLRVSMQGSKLEVKTGAQGVKGESKHRESSE